MWVYFVDPVLRAPTIGSMLMCLAAALVGVLLFLRRQSLLGEALSHAAYPGVVIGALVASPFLTPENENLVVASAVFGGAAVTASLAMIAINLLKNLFRVRTDAALCFVLATFFGIGITIASRVQFTHTNLYLRMQAYLYGQPATMTDKHVFAYAFLVAAVLIVVALLYKELQVYLFDRQYASSLGLAVNALDAVLMVLAVLAVVVGIRSVGVVLMSAMLIAPAATARQLSRKVSTMLIVAAGVGLVSGFLGNCLSLEIPRWLGARHTARSFVLPTGPMIVLVASGLCLLALLAAPERGLLARVWRWMCFRHRCLIENVLKSIWKQEALGGVVHLAEMQRWQPISPLYLRLLLSELVRHGFVVARDGGFALTAEGQRRGANIVRLHRLWELYLTQCLGMGRERVHKSAEEIEHIITPELEEELTQLLGDPQRDPHQQPIPPRAEERGDT